MKPLTKSIAVVVGLLFAAYVACVAGLYLRQDELLYTHEPHRVSAAASGLGSPLRDVAIHTNDGLILVGWYAPPSRLGAPVVLFFHGNGGGIRYFTGTAQRLMSRGDGVLMAEYRGYNGNPGHASEATIKADARAWLRLLTNDEHVPLDRIVIAGQSLGTGVAVDLAAATPGTAALVLLSPYTSLPDIAATRYPFVPVHLLMRNRFDSIGRIRAIRTPLLVLHGGRDSVIPIRFGGALFDAAPEPKTFMPFANAGHYDLYDHGAFDAMADYMERRVGP